jgi:hypothetical protein
METLASAIWQAALELPPSKSDPALQTMRRGFFSWPMHAAVIEISAHTWTF